MKKKEQKTEDRKKTHGEKKSGKGKTALQASITVEASLVMAVVLFTCAAVLGEGFRVHERTAGMLILMDAAEMAQTGIDRESSIKESEKWANRAISSFYRSAGNSISIEQKGKDLIGVLNNRKGREEGTVQIKQFEPQQFLRIVRAIGI